MPTNQRSAIMRERMLVHWFGPRLEEIQAKPRPTFHGYVVDTKLDSDFKRPMQSHLSGASVEQGYTVQEKRYNNYDHKSLRTSSIFISYSAIHPDLVAKGKAGLRHDAKIEASAIAKELWNDVAGIKSVKTIFDDANQRLILEMRNKDLRKFENEVRNGQRPRPKQSPNITWIERYQEAQQLGCKDARYWR